jgi:hypothetical protein
MLNELKQLKAEYKEEIDEYEEKASFTVDEIDNIKDIINMVGKN